MADGLSAPGTDERERRRDKAPVSRGEHHGRIARSVFRTAYDLYSVTDRNSGFQTATGPDRHAGDRLGRRHVEPASLQRRVGFAPAFARLVARRLRPGFQARRAPVRRAARRRARTRRFRPGPARFCGKRAIARARPLSEARRIRREIDHALRRQGRDQTRGRGPVRREGVVRCDRLHETRSPIRISGRRVARGNEVGSGSDVDRRRDPEQPPGHVVRNRQSRPQTLARPTTAPTSAGQGHDIERNRHWGPCGGGGVPVAIPAPAIS